jgi:hypothetical protein
MSLVPLVYTSPSQVTWWISKKSLVELGRDRSGTYFATGEKTMEESDAEFIARLNRMLFEHKRDNPQSKKAQEIVSEAADRQAIQAFLQPLTRRQSDTGSTATKEN